MQVDGQDTKDDEYLNSIIEVLNPMDIVAPRDLVGVPTFAYQVSGEYSMLKLAINNEWLHKDVMLESLVSIKRSGADAILTYAAKEISKEIFKS